MILTNMKISKLLMVLVFTAYNSVVLPVSAKTLQIEAVGSYTCGNDSSEDLNIAKQRAATDAKLQAADKIGVYIDSYSKSQNYKLEDDIVRAVAAAVLKIKNEDVYPVIDDITNSVKLVCKITAEIDTERIDLKKIMADRVAIEQNVELQKRIAELEIENSNLKTAYDNKINSLNKLEINKQLLLNKNSFIATQYFEKGNAFYNSQDYYAAIEMYSKAIEYNPREALAYTYRGLTYSKLNKFKESIIDYNIAVKLKPVLSIAYFYRGNTFMTIGNYTQAISDFSKTLSISPTNSAAYYKRGKCYEAIGDNSRANTDHYRAKELGYE